ncbi:uncharacterized protein LOC5510176 isoform X5 [Nematostella vectensis]|uniref:uncharacterized protein LOC5510176 isoform X5 n=1 Tax=Nematostella vectensis TaxID=45351 RepID=UPI002076FD9B|nr:uncharacterized protein LOC5510176 isoform X5 [Nematostella vectensis]
MEDNKKIINRYQQKSRCITLCSSIREPEKGRNIPRSTYRCGVWTDVSAKRSHYCKHSSKVIAQVDTIFMADPLFAGVLMRCLYQSQLFGPGLTAWMFDKWRKRRRYTGCFQVVDRYYSISFKGNQELHKLHTYIKFNIRIILTPSIMPISIHPDLKWSKRLLSLVLVYMQLFDVMAWLSTLGGAYSSLGDHCTSFSVKAGITSVKQLLVARKLGNPLLESQCQVFLAMSLVQRGFLKKARHIIRQQYRCAVSNGIRDTKLIASCQAIWNRIRYVQQQKNVSNVKSTELKAH